MFLICSSILSAESAGPVNVPGAQSFLKRYPAADANKDGILTIEEKRDHSQQLAIDALGGNVHISSSNSPKYEVHPNTFKPADSFDASPIATNTSEFPRIEG